MQGRLTDSSVGFRPVLRPRLTATVPAGWLCSLGPARPPLHNFANVAGISGTACRPSMDALFRGSAGRCMQLRELGGTRCPQGGACRHAARPATFMCANVSRTPRR